MTTIYRNFLSGVTTDNPLSSSATAINSAAFASLPVVAAPTGMWLVLDPEGLNGAPEIVRVTAHTAAATTVTVTRAQQLTVARSHPVGTAWAVAATQSDLDELPFRRMTATGDILYASAANVAERRAIGTTGQALVVSAGLPVWGQLGADGIADGAVTSAKIADGTITNSDIAAAAGIELTKLAAAAPRGVMGYAQRTTSQTGITTAGADLTDLSITFTAVAGRRYRITGYVRARQQTLAGAVTVRILDDATQIQQAAANAVASEVVNLVPSIVVAPSAGSKTYKLNLITNTSTVDSEPLVTAPAYILVEDIGAA